MRTWYIEKRVEVDAVAAGSHRETKRGIDHTRIWALWAILCSRHLLIPDLNQRLSHIWQGTNCTAQPTVDGMLLLSVQKAKRRNRPTDRNDGIITFCKTIAKYKKSKAEKYAQFFG